MINDIKLKSSNRKATCCAVDNEKQTFNAPNSKKNSKTTIVISNIRLIMSAHIFLDKSSSARIFLIPRFLVLFLIYTKTRKGKVLTSRQMKWIIKNKTLSFESKVAHQYVLEFERHSPTTKGRTTNTYMYCYTYQRDGSHIVSAWKQYLHVLSCIGDYSIDPTGLHSQKRAKRYTII